MQKTENAPVNLIGLLFFASGISALIYQVSWQRILFASFGTDLESVTIIISSFMLGLGLGALAGGWAGDRWPRLLLILFAAAEAGVGLYGLASSGLLLWASEMTLYSSPAVIASVNFFLVLIPTTLMGATLPILITYLTRIWKHVGRSTGTLYAFNTLGATLGAFLTGFVLFHVFKLNSVIEFAAYLNLSVAITVALILRRKTT